MSRSAWTTGACANGWMMAKSLMPFGFAERSPKLVGSLEDICHVSKRHPVDHLCSPDWRSAAIQKRFVSLSLP